MTEPALGEGRQAGPRIEGLSAVTLTTADMARAVQFYEALGFERLRGGPAASFTTFRAGRQYLNITAESVPAGRQQWGRAIFHVSDVDAVYRQARERGLKPEFAPSDAPWGERYFHILDADGHEISLARPLEAGRDPAG